MMESTRLNTLIVDERCIARAIIIVNELLEPRIDTNPRGLLTLDALAAAVSKILRPS
jgi:hypothetical protein